MALLAAVPQSVRDFGNALLVRPQQRTAEDLETSAAISVHDHMVAPQPRRLGGFEDYLNIEGGSPWVHACVRILSNSVARIPYSLFRTSATSDKETKVTLSDGPNYAAAMRVFQKPNATTTRFNLIKWTVASLELTGNAYWEKSRWNTTGRVGAFYPVRPHKMNIVPDPTLGVNHFVFHSIEHGRPVTVELSYNDVAHFKYMSPIDDLYGLGSMRPAERYALLDFYAETHQEMFFRRGAIPDAIINFENGLSKEQKEYLETKWRNKFEGVEKSHGFLLATGKVGVQVLQPSAKDMDWRNLRDLNRDAILASFGVAPSVLGVAIERSVAQENRKQFWENSVIPIAKYLEEELNCSVLPEFADDLVIRFDFASIEAFIEDSLDRAKRITIAHEGGIISTNEARQLLFPELNDFEGGDLVFKSVNFAPFGDTRIPPGTPQGVPLLIPDDESNMLVDNMPLALPSSKQYVDLRKQDLLEDVFEEELASAYLQLEGETEDEDSPVMFLILLSTLLSGATKSIVDQTTSIAINEVARRLALLPGGTLPTNEIRSAIATQIASTMESFMAIHQQTGLNLFAKLREQLSITTAVETTLIRQAGTIPLMAVSFSTTLMGLIEQTIGELSRTRMIKQWFDNRDTHVRGNPVGLYPAEPHDHWALNGQTVELNKRFVDPRSKVLYRWPGDPLVVFDARAGCRCRMKVRPA